MRTTIWRRVCAGLLSLVIAASVHGLSHTRRLVANAQQPPSHDAMLTNTPHVASVASIATLRVASNTTSGTMPDTTFNTTLDTTSNTCPTPVLNQLVRHKLQPGETLAAIAQRYNLIPATLIGLNPVLQRRQEGATPIGTQLAGTEILIPPYNGIRVQAKPNQTWQDLAAIYGVRADVLFEANGCQLKPTVVFVPGVNWSPTGIPQPSSAAAQAVVRGYPLPKPTTILLGYGWRLHPALGQVAFHSGVDLQALPATPVLAVANGIVAFADQQGTYGKLVVINHDRGIQTRYAQLGSIQVQAGQAIRMGDRLGGVGSTGVPSSVESHLHFEVRYNSSLGWVAQDPAPMLNQQ